MRYMLTLVYILQSFEKRRLGFFDGGVEGYRKVGTALTKGDGKADLMNSFSK